MATDPYEIIVAPADVYLAPVDESWPDNDETPSGNWALLGSAGKSDYTEDGVRVRLEQDVARIRSLGGTGVRKTVRSTEDIFVTVPMQDNSIAEIAKGMNVKTVTSTAAGSGTPGHDNITLYRGRSVTLRAMIVKLDESPFGDGWTTQWELPIVSMVGNIEIMYHKEDQAVWGWEFLVQEDPDASSAGEEFGWLRMQDATAL